MKNKNKEIHTRREKSEREEKDWESEKKKMGLGKEEGS
jgi:hypothetical protein